MFTCSKSVYRLTLGVLVTFFLLLLGCERDSEERADFRLSSEQITFGPKHHFFGYIGQSLTIPWSGNGRYIVALEMSFHDRLPEAEDAVTVVLIDTENENDILRLDQTKAWNLQQGTMLYWNPQNPDTQFFFNDRDARDGRVHTVLYDIEQRARVKEYRYDDHSLGNSGVSPSGGHFLAINYGRLARLRPVTGYPGALDGTEGEFAPLDDGVFKIDVRTGEKSLLVSYRELKEKLRSSSFYRESKRWAPTDGPTVDKSEGTLGPEFDREQLYINHTLWSRGGKRIYFLVRGRFGKRSISIDAPCTINADGSGLELHTAYIGGHPEWADGDLIIGESGGRQVYYDVSKKRIEERKLGDFSIFPKTGGDVSLSPDGEWFANGYSSDDRQTNHYVVMRLSDQAFARSEPFDRGPYVKGDLRIDPAPRWNRDSDALLAPGWTTDGTRQLYVIRVINNDSEKDPPSP